MWKWPAIILLSCVVPAVAAGPAIVPKNPPPLSEEIRQAHQEWLSRLFSVQLEYEIRYYDEEKPPGWMATLKGDWAWTDDGRRREGRATINADGVQESSLLWTRDGNRDYRWHTHDPEGSSDRPRNIVIEPAGGGRSVAVTPLHGLWWSNRQAWFLQEPDRMWPAGDGPTVVDGRECVPVGYDYADVDWAYALLDLDPRAGYLPRRFQPIQPPRNTQEYDDTHVETVEEFSEPLPGFYFPRAGTAITPDGEGAPARLEWRITSLRINEPIPDSHFRIKPVDGTYVVDRARDVRYIHGADSARSKIQGQRVAEAKENLAEVKDAEEFSGSARPDPGSSVRRAAWIMGTFFVVCGISLLAMRWRLS